ncbi:MAG TPA: site-specific integrase [Gemmata sp.]|jgi:integrase|nr:site-specific integrase [Gemmata sp.]
MEIEASPLRSPEAKRDGVSINELMLAFIEHAEQHYRRADGSITDEFAEFKRISRHVREFYGDTPAADFGPLALKTVRQKFIAAGWSRGFINQRIGKVRRVFKWAVGEELIPPSTYQALSVVSGLQRGRTKARETKPVGPVDDAVVDTTLSHLSRHVQGLIELQRLTGCRPGEACAIRRCDTDTGGAIWLYKPPHHKTIHRGKTRIIAIGPKAQNLLRQFFTPNLDDFLFSPRKAREERNAERSVNRKTPRYPSQVGSDIGQEVLQILRELPAHRFSNS